MREELVYSRVLLVFLLVLASTAAWSHNHVDSIGTFTEPSNDSSLYGDIELWPKNDGVLVASNGKYPRADLSLDKSVDKQAPWVGEVVTFTITVNNVGPKGADYSFEDVVPNGFSNITHISSGGTLHGNTIVWKNQWIDAGKSQSFTFRATVDAQTGVADEYKNTAQITSSNKPDPDSTPNNDDGDQSEDDEDYVTLVPKKNEADLSLHKSVNNHTPNINEVVTFTITVNNAGPKGADYSFEDVVPNGFSNITHISNGGTLHGNTIVWKNQWIDAGESQSFIFYATVNKPNCKATDQYKNVAQITNSNKSDPDSTPNNDDGDQSEDDEDFAIVTPNTRVAVIQ